MIIVFDKYSIKYIMKYKLNKAPPERGVLFLDNLIWKYEEK